jgi:hypothetical protein
LSTYSNPSKVSPDRPKSYVNLLGNQAISPVGIWYCHIVTDHKPLVTLFNNPSSKPSARIERWLLDLQQYRFTVEYRPGVSNPADYSSRHPMGDPESRKYEDEAEEHIAFVAKNAVPKAVTLSET